MSLNPSCDIPVLNNVTSSLLALRFTMYGIEVRLLCLRGLLEGGFFAYHYAVNQPHTNIIIS